MMIGLAFQVVRTVLRLQRDVLSNPPFIVAKLPGLSGAAARAWVISRRVRAFRISVAASPRTRVLLMSSSLGLGAERVAAVMVGVFGHRSSPRCVAQRNLRSADRRVLSNSALLCRRASPTAIHSASPRETPASDATRVMATASFIGARVITAMAPCAHETPMRHHAATHAIMSLDSDFFDDRGRMV
jgi:hypothetical protein